MSHLDNRSIIKQIDQHNYISHLLDIPEQLVEGFSLGSEVRLPALYAQAKQVIILTSGEMLPVALALESLMVDYARVPVVIVEDFVLPKWVSTDTLVIALDYNGDSEEVLTAFREAAKRRARLLSVSIAGELASESRRFRSPHVALNYGAPARTAFYYTLSCLCALAKKLDFIELKEATVVEASVLCRSLLQTIHPEVAQYKNQAKQLAEKVINRKVFIVGSGLLIPVAKKWQTTFAATGKVAALYSTTSEFNDTIINSLGYQSKTAEQPMIVMLQSKYSHSRVKLQQTLIYQVAQARKIVYEAVFMHPSGSPLGEIVLASLMGDWVSYYLALLLAQDPSFMEATLYVKEQLAQQPMTDS